MSACKCIHTLYVYEANLQQTEFQRATKEFKKWKVHSKDMRAKVKLAETLNPWSAKTQVVGAAALPRARDNLDVCYWKLRSCMPGMSADMVERDSWCHVSQSVERLPCKMGMMPCLVANSLMYSYQENVVLSGIAHMRVIGWEEDDCAQLTDAEGRDLAGNAFSIPNATLVSACCVANPYAPWWM